ncbi:hypothetical protein BGX21_007837 [Mortierella sp. AD011]|nr:hypothetical protein BGX20_002203 [Mortierella sp. AD010]KAF9398399.1 hypothetical protein BGX21_007837 [Mortierella sp. AD011]
MFGIKFKRKEKADSTSTPVESGPKAESTSLSSTPSANTTPMILSPSSSTTSPTDAIHLSGSNGSSQLQFKTSLTSLNNSNNNNNHYNNNTMINNNNGFHSLSINDRERNYKIPLDGGDDVKVPVSDAVAERIRSNTFGSYTYGHSGIANANINNTISNSINNSNVYMSPSAAIPATIISENERRNSQGPKINPATKPAAGTFAAATVTGTPDFMINANNTATVGGVPTSAASSATPSRSSSTSNRGAAGSFTPLSVTPPMTPHLTHEGVSENNITNGYDTVSGTGAISLMPPIASTSSPLSSTAATGLYQPMHLQQANQTPVIYSPPSGGIGEDVSPSAMSFVSSPVSYQPPPNSLSVLNTSQEQQQQALLQDNFQFQYMPVINEEGSSTKIVPATSIVNGGDSNHASPTSTIHGNAARDALLQQLQQQKQFQQQLASTSNTYNPVLSSSAAVGPVLPPPSTDHSSSTPTAPFSPAVDLQQPHQSQHQTTSPPDNPPTSVAGTQAHAGFGGVAGGGSAYFPNPVTRTSTLASSTLITHDVRPFSEQAHIIDGSGPVVLIAIGKTGQGKSSLLNKIMGTRELKASASVRAVTKGIAERSGWGRFEDSRRVLVTVADTPGLADTEGDDEKNIPILKEYIKSVGTRLGITAFLLVFKIDSGVDMIITILASFNDIMKDFPDFWDNVVLVFTGCDYRRNVMNTKQLYHDKIQAQLQEHFFKDRGSNQESPNGSNSVPPTEPTVPIVFLSCAEAPCGFSLGEKCDCKARTAFLNAGIKRLWYAVKGKRRWVLNQDDEDDGIHS